MKSQTIGHFPQVRFADGQKWLFNPVLKKRFANRPEERIRLQYVDFLLHQTNISHSRIGIEAPVRAESSENTLRADLVLYTREMSAHTLIECKSERIKLNDKTAEQAARYNQSLKAEFLMITNGHEDYWYKNEDNSVVPLKKNPIETVKKTGETVYGSKYWIDRGFLDTSLPKKNTGAVSGFLNSMFMDSDDAAISYLTLPTDIAPILLDHYYRIYTVNSGQSLAVSTIRAQPDQTVLSVMMNKEGKNRGILWVPLRDLLLGESAEAVCLTPTGTRNFAIPDKFGSLIDHLSESSFEKFINHLINFFD